MSRNARRTEEGAVAVLVALLAVTLLVICGLIVDLGLARDTKRQSQNAADASSLAAINALWPGSPKCSDNMAVPPCWDDAVTSARTYAQNNFGVTPADWSACTDVDHLYVHTGSPECISFAGASGGTAKPANPTRVRVVVPVRDVKTGFGTLAGTSSIPISALAEAGVEKPEAGGLRPWGICSGVANVTGNVTFVPMKGGSTGDPQDDCGTSGPPGGWWVAQCTGQGNGNGQTELIVTNGCPTSGYTPVPGQPTGSPATLYDFLTDACPKKAANNTCLSSDPGNNFHNSSDEWQPLVGQTFVMPVFCDRPTCSQMANAGGGNNASYAIHKMATVELCGFEMSPRAPSTSWPTSGPCATNNPAGYKSSDVVSGAGFFLVIKALHGGGTEWEMAGQVSPPNLVR